MSPKPKSSARMMTILGGRLVPPVPAPPAPPPPMPPKVPPPVPPAPPGTAIVPPPAPPPASASRRIHRAERGRPAAAARTRLRPCRAGHDLACVRRRMAGRADPSRLGLAGGVPHGRADPGDRGRRPRRAAGEARWGEPAGPRTLSRGPAGYGSSRVIFPTSPRGSPDIILGLHGHNEVRDIGRINAN